MDLAQQTGSPNYHLNALQIRQYQNFNFSLHANIFKLNFHNIKSAFHYNMHAGYLRTLLSDSIKFKKGDRPVYSDAEQTRNVNSFMWGFDVIYEVKPDSRYGFLFGYEWNIIRPKNDLISLSPENRKIQAFWSEGFLKTNEESKLFFRFRYNNLWHKSRTNFMQVQLGYLVDLFKASKQKAGAVSSGN